jgi:hypothetical protein
VYDRLVDVWWLVIGGIVLAVVVGLVVYFRSLRRWRQAASTSEEAKQAEARLWSTRSMDQR